MYDLLVSKYFYTHFLVILLLLIVEYFIHFWCKVLLTFKCFAPQHHPLLSISTATTTQFEDCQAVILCPSEKQRVFELLTFILRSFLFLGLFSGKWSEQL